MTPLTGVLIYDGECPFCSAAASALRHLPEVGAVPWEADAAQSFLTAQFGESPFALVYVDVEDRTVYVGREAARELCDRAGIPVLASDLVADNYETIADAIRTVSAVDEEPDPYHDTVPLNVGASTQEELLTAATRDSVHDHLAE